MVEVLRLAAGDGRLTVEELDERVGAALTARTYGELTALVSDLPAAQDTPAGPPGAPGPKDLVRIECHHSGARRDGQWLVPRRMQIQVTIGNVPLDFTQAILSWPALQIDVQIHSGTLTLVTRPGIMVDTDDLEILQASTVKVLAPWDLDVPVRFRIDVAGTLDVSRITARPPRRTLSQQLLLRRPLLQPLPPPSLTRGAGPDPEVRGESPVNDLGVLFRGHIPRNNTPRREGWVTASGCRHRWPRAALWGVRLRPGG